MNTVDRKRFEKRLSALERKQADKDWRAFVIAVLVYTLSASAFIWVCNAIAVWTFQL